MALGAILAAGSKIAASTAGSVQGTYGKNGSSGSSWGNNTAQSWTNGRDATIANMRSAYERMSRQQTSWEDTAAYNAQQARLQREWEEYMSNTAYQRAVRDMQTAGINPILAYTQGGASTPNGLMATMSPISGAQGNAVADSGSSAYGVTGSTNNSWGWYDNNIKGLANSVGNAFSNIFGEVTADITEQSIRTGHRVDINSLASTAKNLTNKASKIVNSIASVSKNVAKDKEKYSH